MTNAVMLIVGLRRKMFDPLCFYAGSGALSQMEPSKEVPAATQPVVNRAPRIMPVEKPALALQMDSATPKISGEP